MIQCELSEIYLILVVNSESICLCHVMIGSAYLSEQIFFFLQLELNIATEIYPHVKSTRDNIAQQQHSDNIY